MKWNLPPKKQKWGTTKETFLAYKISNVSGNNYLIQLFCLSAVKDMHPCSAIV